MAYFNRFLQISFFALSLLIGSASMADTCSFQQKITYADGEKGCLTDLPLASAVAKGWGRSVESIAQTAGFYAVAASASCSDVTVAIANNRIQGMMGNIEEKAISLCSKGCDCAVVVSNGRVLLPKSLAMVMASKNSEVATAEALEVQKQKVDKLREQLLADEVKLRDQEQAKKQAQLKEQQQLAAAEKLRQQNKFEEEAKLKDQVRLSQEAQKQEAVKLAEASRLRQDQLRLESEKLKEEARLEQEARLKDRELLAQLSAELARLRAEASAKTLPPSQPANAAITSPEPSPIFANRKALVIGNDSYKFVSKLANAREDAKVIADNLSTVGFKVTLKLDLTEKEMKATLRTFKSQLEPGDEVAFFFAGHGIQLANSNYLIPVDVAGEGEEQIKDEGIALQRILDDIGEKKAKFTIAMIDACRDNPFKTAGRAIGGRGLAPTTAATGQMVIFSAGTGQQALDKLSPTDSNKNGLFTRIFIKEIQKPNVSIDRVVKNVRNQVAELAKSVGHEQVPAIYDQALGDFYFKR